MFLFYSNQILGSSITLSDDEHQHCHKVLRKSIGDEIFITDGKGHIHTAIISAFKKSTTICKIKETTTKPKPTSQLCIAIAPTKNASRIEWFVEKSIEIGISTIYLFQSQRTLKKSNNLNRIDKIAISAMKQSMNIYLPEIKYCNSINELFKETENISQKYIATCEGPREMLRHLHLSETDAIVLIGPEGDFTNEEVENAEAHHFKPVSLGESRLRTETAGLVALMTMSLK